VIEVVLNLALEFDRGKTDLYAIKRLLIRIRDIYKKNRLVIWHQRIKDDFIENKIELTIYTRYPAYYYFLNIKRNNNTQRCYDEISQVINSFKFSPSYKYIWLS